MTPCALTPTIPSPTPITLSRCFAPTRPRPHPRPHLQPLCCSSYPEGSNSRTAPQLPKSEWKRAGERRLSERETGGADGEEGGSAPVGAQPFAADFETAVETEWGDEGGGGDGGSAGGGGGAAGGSGVKRDGGGGAADGDGKACGVVMGIIKRGWRPYVCVLDPESGLAGGSYLVEPQDMRIPRINITTRQPDTLSGKLLVVSVDFWEAQHRFPTGHYVRTIGAVGDTRAESDAILLEHEVNTAPFSAQVQSCLPAKGWQIPSEEIERRLDLRNGRALVCSVDPPGCVDIDDALHAKELPPAADGSRRFEVGVHIADVGHFIKAGTPIDTEVS